MLFRNSFFFLIIISLLVSCKTKKESERSVNFSIKDVEKIYRKNNTLGLANEIKSLAEDSIKTWIEFDLSAYQYEKGNNWKVDSLICFNKVQNKAVMAILNQDKFPTSKNDGIQYFYGVQVLKKWYFFKGPFIVLFRESYGNHKGVPLSFPQLHAIAMKEVFRGYLKKNANGPSHGGEWEINEAFFDRIEFQYEKWAYWDTNGNLIDNKTIGKDSLQKLYLNRIIYDKYK